MNHEKLKAEYEAEAKHNTKAWKNWQVCTESETEWADLIQPPWWKFENQYRRNPDAPDWRKELFKAGQELTHEQVLEYYKVFGSLDGIQFQREGDTIWNDKKAPTIRFDSKYRVAPAPKPMIRVNGVIVPKHETVSPSFDSNYFAVELDRISNFQWKNDIYDDFYLNSGLIYLNEQDAQARLDAMLKFEDV